MRISTRLRKFEPGMTAFADKTDEERQTPFGALGAIRATVECWKEGTTSAAYALNAIDEIEALWRKAWFNSMKGEKP